MLTWGLLGPGRGSNGSSTPYRRYGTSPRCRTTSSSGRRTPGCSNETARPTGRAAGSRRSSGCGGHGDLQVGVPGCCSPRRAGRFGRRGDPPVRLARAGDVRGAHRGGDRASPRDRHRLCTRRRAPRDRRRPPRRPRRPRRDGAAIRQVLLRACSGGQHGEPGRCAGPRARSGRRSRPATASSPATSPSTDVIGRGVSIPAPTFEHVLRLSDDIGIFEHAEGSTPRRHHGYCLDDVARALVVVAREPDPSDVLIDLTRRYLEFVVSAQAPDGRCHNRLGLDRRWEDRPGIEDCWGRALWGLGPPRPAPAIPPSASSGHPVRATARGGDVVIARRWPSPHSARPRSSPCARTTRWRGACSRAAARLIGRPTGSDRGRGPRPGSAYANAALPEALLAAGEHLGDAPRPRRRLFLLGWLLEHETRDDHLVGDTRRAAGHVGEARPGFDQQPIEVAALADACARAFRLTGDRRWAWASSRRSDGSWARTTRRVALRADDWRWVRRPPCGRSQREPGGRIDLGPGGHAAAARAAARGA